MKKLRLNAVSFLLLSLPVFLYGQAMAQQSAATPAQDSSAITPENVSSAPQSNQPRRIMPGDVLSIQVHGRMALSRDDARVDATGMIEMPLIDGDIQAVCRTESELAQLLTAQYEHKLVTPNVSVTVREYVSTPVAIIGAVSKAGRFELQKRISLRELLALGGGTTKAAKGIVQIHRIEGAAVCGAPGGKVILSKADGVYVIAYKLEEVLYGNDESNPFLQPGDIVSVPWADQIYIVGNVDKPQAFTLQSPLTVLEAIAMAGGTLRKSNLECVRIIRSAGGFAGSYKIIIRVNLKAISKGEADDILLQANDVVEVPCEGRCPSRREEIFKPLSEWNIPYIIR